MTKRLNQSTFTWTEHFTAPLKYGDTIHPRLCDVINKFYNIFRPDEASLSYRMGGCH